jgi:hypothetical protein
MIEICLFTLVGMNVGLQYKRSPDSLVSRFPERQKTIRRERLKQSYKSEELRRSSRLASNSVVNMAEEGSDNDKSVSEYNSQEEFSYDSAHEYPTQVCLVS